MSQNIPIRSIIATIKPYIFKSSLYYSNTIQWYIQIYEQKQVIFYLFIKGITINKKNQVKKGI